MANDLVDLANETTEVFLRASLDKHKNQNSNLSGDGFCIWCGDKVYPIVANLKLITPRWCSKECRDDYEVENNF